MGIIRFKEQIGGAYGDFQVGSRAALRNSPLRDLVGKVEEMAVKRESTPAKPT
jgi:hypothetical protein